MARYLNNVLLKYPGIKYLLKEREEREEGEERASLAWFPDINSDTTAITYILVSPPHKILDKDVVALQPP